MLNLPPTMRIYACTTPCDMRKQIDGLAALVEHQLGHDARVLAEFTGKVVQGDG